MPWDPILGRLFDSAHGTSGVQADRRVHTNNMYSVMIRLNGKEVRIVDNMKDRRTVRIDAEYPDGSIKTHKTFFEAECVAARFLKG